MAVRVRLVSKLCKQEEAEVNILWAWEAEGRDPDRVSGRWAMQSNEAKFGYF